MASIGGLTFDTLHGRPNDPLLAIEATERVGVDGSELRDIGYREREAAITTMVTCADATSADSVVAAYHLLEGTIITVVDAFGVSHANCLIVSVTPAVQAVLKPTANPTHTAMVTARWRVRKLYVVASWGES